MMRVYKKNEVSKSNDLSLSLSSVRFVFFLLFLPFFAFFLSVIYLSVALVCQLFALLERDIQHFNHNNARCAYSIIITTEGKKW